MRSHLTLLTSVIGILFGAVFQVAMTVAWITVGDLTLTAMVQTGVATGIASLVAGVVAAVVTDSPASDWQRHFNCLVRPLPTSVRYVWPAT